MAEASSGRSELLLEIGFEEMPAPWLPGLTAQLRDLFAAAAEREKLEAREVAAYSTPRRLVLRAEMARRRDTDEKTAPALME